MSVLDVLWVVLPIFLVVGAGYGAVRAGLFSDEVTEGVLSFAQNFAIPCLLFLAILDLDLATAFDPRFMGSFYGGAAVCFFTAVILLRRISGLRPGESIAVGFGALFSNSVLMGLPIMARAFGPDSLGPNYVLISFHAPFCFLLAITMMEVSRADGRTFADTARATLRAMFRNALMVGLLLGFAVNLSGLRPPEPAMAAVEMVASAGLPAALFALGGVLTRYRVGEGIGQSVIVTILSLIVHPAITFVLTVMVFALPADMVRSAVLTAAMAPGVNTYIFASMYNRGVGAAASTVILSTLVSILSISAWLVVLAGAGY